MSERVDLPRHRRPPVGVADQSGERRDSLVELRSREVDWRERFVVGNPSAADDVHAPFADQGPEEVEPRAAARVVLLVTRGRDVGAVPGRCIAALAL